MALYWALRLFNKSMNSLHVGTLASFWNWYGFIYFGSVGNSFQSPSGIFGGCSRFLGSWNKTRHSGTRQGTKSGLSIRIPPKTEGAPWNPDFHNPSCFKGSPLNQTQQRSFAEVVDFGAAMMKSFYVLYESTRTIQKIILIGPVLEWWLLLFHPLNGILS